MIGAAIVVVAVAVVVMSVVVVRERGCREGDVGADGHQPGDERDHQHETRTNAPRGPQSCHGQIFARS